MKRGSLTGIGAGIVVALLMGMYALGSSPPNNAPGGFGKKVAGTYHGLIDGQFPFLVTVGADGTVTSTDVSDFGFGIKGFGFESPAHGAYASIGPRDAHLVSLWFNYDESGTLTSIGRSDIISHSAHDFNSFTGSILTRLYAPGTDPLDAETEPIVVFPEGTLVGQRLEVNDDD